MASVRSRKHSSTSMDLDQAQQHRAGRATAHEVGNIAENVSAGRESTKRSRTISVAKMADVAQTTLPKCWNQGRPPTPGTLRPEDLPTMAPTPGDAPPAATRRDASDRLGGLEVTLVDGRPFAESLKHTSHLVNVNTLTFTPDGIQCIGEDVVTTARSQIYVPKESCAPYYALERYVFRVDMAILNKSLKILDKAPRLTFKRNPETGDLALDMRGKSISTTAYIAHLDLPEDVPEWFDITVHPQYDGLLSMHAKYFHDLVAYQAQASKHVVLGHNYRDLRMVAAGGTMRYRTVVEGSRFGHIPPPKDEACMSFLIPAPDGHDPEDEDQWTAEIYPMVYLLALTMAYKISPKIRLAFGPTMPLILRYMFDTEGASLTFFLKSCSDVMETPA